MPTNLGLPDFTDPASMEALATLLDPPRSVDDVNLPPTPSDGEEFVYRWAGQVAWKVRFSSGSAAWDFIGGAEYEDARYNEAVSSMYSTSVPATVGDYSGTLGVPHTVNPPKVGSYDFTWAIRLSKAGGVASHVKVALRKGTTPSGGKDTEQAVGYFSAGGEITVVGHDRLDLTAGMSVTMVLASSVASETYTVRYSSIRYRPVRWT